MPSVRRVPSEETLRYMSMRKGQQDVMRRVVSQAMLKDTGVGKGCDVSPCKMRS